jgi:hypothetical protein
MTRADLIIELAAVERTINSRTIVWRTIIDANGNVVKRVIRRTNHTSHTSEAQLKERHHDLSLRDQKD